MSLHKKKFAFEDPEDSYWNESGSSNSASLFDDLPSKQWAARAAVDNLFDAREPPRRPPPGDGGDQLRPPQNAPRQPSVPAITTGKAGEGDANLKMYSEPGAVRDEKLDNFLKSKPEGDFEINATNRAPSIISENSASSLPSEAQRLDLDYNRLRAEHRKLQRHLETIRHERFQPLDVRETVKRLQKGEPVTLDLYRTKQDKLQLLEAAMNTYDSDTVQRIMIFLRTTLGDTAFREVLMFHPEAAEEFIDYLKTVQEYEQLNTIYLWLGRHDDAHMVEIATAMRLRSPEQKLAGLRRCAQNEQLDSDVSLPIRNYVALLERQIQIQNADCREKAMLPKDGRLNAPLPFHPALATLYYINLYHFRAFESDIRNPSAFKQAMSLSEKEFIWVAISAHVHRDRWQEIERLLESKTGIFAPKAAQQFSWEFLFKLFHRAAHRPPITFLEKVCSSIPDSELRQKIGHRYRISLIQQQQSAPANKPTGGRLGAGFTVRPPKIPFLSKK